MQAQRLQPLRVVRDPKHRAPVSPVYTDYPRMPPSGLTILERSPTLLIFSFSFRFWSAFMTSPTERERSNFRFSIPSLCQRGTSQVLNIQLVRTNYVPQHSGIMMIQNVYHVCMCVCVCVCVGRP